MVKQACLKKHTKKVARRDKVAAKKRRDEDLMRKHEFPRLVFEPNSAPPEFVEAVRQAAADIDFCDPTLFPKWETLTYRRMKEVGYPRAIAEMHRGVAVAGQDAELILTRFHLGFGEAVLSRIPRDFLLKFVPFHDVLFDTRGHDIVARFRSLRHAKGPDGTLYYSVHEPKLEVGGMQLTVSFSAHAIQRACERLCFSWPSYAALGDVYAFFEECLEFEQCDLHGGVLGFTFYEECVPGFWNYGIAEEVLGEQFAPGGEYGWRAGYCPAVIEGRFIKAKTTLFPGYDSTPEYGKLLRADLPRQRKQEMLDEVKRLNRKRMLEPQGIALLKWFHDQGVPQVRPGRLRYARPSIK
jgi:hypothetical protein